MPFEYIVGAAVGAAATSQNARKVVRKGLVYGMAGLLVAYDKVVGVTRGIVKGAREGLTQASEPANTANTNGQPATDETAPAKAPAPVTRTTQPTASS
jgi:hypothetical protein